ncbi:MAG: hypothetical protein V5A68_07385 [Candidatus Thermoplasmatota archaeon]
MGHKINKKISIIGTIFIIILIGLTGCNEMNLGDMAKFSIKTFKVEPSIINQGETANLTWLVTGAQTVNINNGIGNVGNTGDRIITPTENTTYTLTAENKTKTLTATTQIIVKQQNDQTDENQPPENTGVQVMGTNEQIKILLSKGGSNAPYTDTTGQNGFDIFLDGIKISHNNFNVGTKWETGESIILEGTIAGKTITAGNEYSITVQIMGSTVYDSYVTVTNGHSQNEEPESASITVTGTNEQIKITLATNEPYPNVSGDTGFDIFLEGTKINHNKFNIGSKWETGESIILKKDATGADITAGDQYALTVQILGSVVYDSYITVVK